MLRSAAYAALLASACAIAPITSALADRAPTPEERTRIENALRGLGFTSWEEIEFDDGVWEVDDAIGQDGQEYDLKLDPETLAIIKQKRD